jgi:hypothetical protein
LLLLLLLLLLPRAKAEAEANSAILAAQEQASLVEQLDGSAALR